jgi:hypothetical protein
MPYTLGQEADHDIQWPLNSFIMVFGISMALYAPIHYYKNAIVVVSFCLLCVMEDLPPLAAMLNSDMQTCICWHPSGKQIGLIFL